ncbi:MAG: DNA-binding domain-containing protein [Pseudomonadota bacterium]
MPEADFQQVQEAFARHLRDPQRYPAPEGIEGRRLAIYRRLFFNNVANLLAKGFPVLRRLLEAAAWEQLVRDFYRDHGSETPYFPQLAAEFVRYLAEERPVQSGDLPFLAELAHYERVETELVYADASRPAEVAPDGDLMSRVPVFSAAARLLAYEYPVHRIGPDFQPEQPEEVPTYLLAYRAGEERVGFAELNPLGARLLWRAIETPATGDEQIRRVAGDFGLEVSDELVASGRQLLEHYRELGAIVGTRPERVSP